MKKLGKIKLNEFSKAELDQRKLNALKGGCDCGSSCSCVYACGISFGIFVNLGNADEAFPHAREYYY